MNQKITLSVSFVKILPTDVLHAVEESPLQIFPVPPGSPPAVVSLPLPVAGVPVIRPVAAGARGGGGGGGEAGGDQLAHVARRELVAALVAPLQVVLHQRAVLLVAAPLDPGAPALPVADLHVLTVHELPLATLALLVQTWQPIKAHNRL